jgi:pimeloyl-ACP methyl ester carboxylesterase
MLALCLLLTQDVERYLAEKDAAARAKILSGIQRSVADVEAELRTPPRRPPAAARGQVIRKPLVADHPLRVPFEYALYVPAAYVPEKRWRLLVSLHGQSGNGPDFTRNWLDDLQRDGETFLLCPSAGRGGWGRSLLGHAYVLDSLRDVAASYSIDPDRVFLDGASMGGNGSFEFVCQYPDLFAGAAPRSGGPMFRFVKPGAKEVEPEGLENLAATPIYWTFGAKDPKLPYEWVKTALARIETLKLDVVVKEHPQGGHEWFPGENAAVLAWRPSAAGGDRDDGSPLRTSLLARNRRLQGEGERAAAFRGPGGKADRGTSGVPGGGHGGGGAFGQRDQGRLDGSPGASDILE